MSGVELSSISKSFGDTSVIEDVSISIADGEFITLLGPSGSGKSTLLRILAGLEGHDTGSVRIGDRDVSGLRPKARDVSMVFQSYALYPHMTVAGNMALPLRMRRLNTWQRLPVLGLLLPGTKATLNAIQADVARTAQAIGIDHLLDRKPGQLSGGQRQRVAVGRAMVRNPAVFLMDEPLSNLDAKLRVQMRAEIKELHKKLGVTFVYVTHDQSEAMTMSDRVAVMLDGRLQQVAPPREIYANPINRKVAEFIGSPKINMLRVASDADGAFRIGDRIITTQRQVGVVAAIYVGIRPEALHSVDSAASGSISAQVTATEDMGPDLFLHVHVERQADPVVCRVPASLARETKVGDRIDLAIRASDFLIFHEDGSRADLSDRNTIVRGAA